MPVSLHLQLLGARRAAEHVARMCRDRLRRERHALTPRCRRPAACAFIVVAIVASASRCAAAPAPDGRAPFEFRSGVLVDPQARLSYLMNTRGGIDALDLRSGRTLWSSAVAEKPLLLLGEILLAQARSENRSNVLRIVRLRAHTGVGLDGETHIDLPDGARADVDDGPGTAFRVRAWPVAAGYAVAWTWSAEPVQAIRDSAAISPQRRERRGAACIELASGAVRSIDAGAAPEEGSTPLPAKLAELKRAGSLPAPLWRSGNVYCAAVRSSKDGVERTVLERWSATQGDRLPDVALFTGRYTIRYPSADNRHLLVSRLESTSPGSAPSYVWLIFSLTSGERIAELRQSSPAAWFFVTGPHLVHEVQAQARFAGGALIEEPKKMRAIDLKTGIERWVCPLRDTAFHGSLPPDGPSGTAPTPRSEGSEDE